MGKHEYINIGEKPVLRHPVMVCGISGWVDGGEAATGSLQYLISKLRARRFAEIPIDGFHIFQVPGQILLRPQIIIEDGLIQRNYAPQNQLFYYLNKNSEHDLILFLGTEPNMHWDSYVRVLLDLAREYKVSRIYLLGGVLNTIPHSKEPNVSCVCSTARLKKEMQQYGVYFNSYEGPGSFSTTLMCSCQEKGLEAISFMASATYYPDFNIIIARNPKSIRAIVTRLISLLQLNLDISDLNDEVQDFESKLNLIAVQSPEFKSHLEELEREYVEISFKGSLGISPDEGVKIAEELLRNKQKES